MLITNKWYKALCLTLDSSGGDSVDDVFLENREDDDRRNDADDRGGRHDVPADSGVRYKAVDRERERILFCIRQQEQRNDELVVRVDEGEDGADGDSGAAYGEDDAREQLEVGAAVNLSGFVDGDGERCKVAFVNGDDEGQIHCRVNKNETPGGVEHSESMEKLVENGENDDAGHHLREQQRELHCFSEAEAVSGDGICRGDGYCRRENGCAVGIEEAVEDSAADDVNGVDVVLPFKEVRDELSLQNIGIRRQRDDERRIDRNDCKQAEQHAQNDDENLQRKGTFIHSLSPPRKCSSR